MILKFWETEYKPVIFNVDIKVLRKLRKDEYALFIVPGASPEILDKFRTSIAKHLQRLDPKKWMVVNDGNADLKIRRRKK